MAANNASALTVDPTWKSDGMLPVDRAPIDEPKLSRATDVWTSYLTHADERDKARVESWKGDMDGILIFSGLFSAVTTAFIVETYKNLQPDNEQMSTELLVRVVASLEHAPNASAVGIIPYEGPSSTISLWINALWFLSLLFSIICAIAATLIQQWSRKYLQRWSSARVQPGIKGRPEFLERTRLRARAHAYFSEGVDTFGLVFIVNCIPFILHLALFLFIAGLVIFAFTINKQLAWLTLVVAIILTVAYVTVTILPAITPACPYRTPLSDALQKAVDALRSKIVGPSDDAANSQSSPSPVGKTPKDGSAAMVESLLIKLNFDKFIINRTMGIWTADSDLTDANIEAVFHALPNVVQPAQQKRPKECVEVVDALLFDKVRIGEELPRLLRSCTAKFPVLKKDMLRRAKACLGLVGLLVKLVDQGQMPPERSQEITKQCIYPALEDTAKLLQEHRTVESGSATLQWEASCTTLLLVGFAFRKYYAALKTVEHTLASPATFPEGFRLDVQELFKIRNRLCAILPAYVSEHLIRAMDMYIPPDNPLYALTADLVRFDNVVSEFRSASQLEAFVMKELVRVKDAYRVFQLTVDMMRLLVESRHPELVQEDKSTFEAVSVAVDWTEAGDLDVECRIRDVVATMLCSDSSMSGPRDMRRGSARERNDLGNLFAANHGMMDEVVTRNLHLFGPRGNGESDSSWKAATGLEMPMLSTSRGSVYSGGEFGAMV